MPPGMEGGFMAGAYLQPQDLRLSLSNLRPTSQAFRSAPWRAVSKTRLLEPPRSDTRDRPLSYGAVCLYEVVLRLLRGA